MKFWDQLSVVGIYQGTSPFLRRSIQLSNRISFVLFALTLLLIILLVFLEGFNIGIQRICFSLLFYALTPLLNYFRYYRVSRFSISVIVPIYTIGLVAAGNSGITPLIYSASYFPPRIITMATCIIPLFVFDTYKEKKIMLGALAVCMLTSVGYDLVLHLIGKNVDFYSKMDVFIYYNFIFFIEFATLVVCAFMLKRAVDKTDNENHKLLNEKESTNEAIRKQNNHLLELNQEIETQHKEMISQAEELRSNQEKIEEANTIIQHQRNELERHNEQLEVLVKEKSKDLVLTNEELIKYNSELRQFSYTVSHNLRGPVARLLGLSNLLTLDDQALTEDQRNILRLLKNSSEELDIVIKDLNKIIDIRNDIYRIKEKVTFLTEYEKIKKSLEGIMDDQVNFTIDFHAAPFVYTIRPLLNSILYNLISNAIKYRSNQRKLEISLKTSIVLDKVVLIISDNGLGMNLEQFGNNIFGMYKRFHTHTDGKGLGLYLVKSQMETLGGKVSVTSALNQGTTFTLEFNIQKDIEGQICFENEYGTIYYNARINLVGLVWKINVNSEQYRTLFSKCLEILRIYKTQLWLSDMRRQGIPSQQDQAWMVENILNEAVQNGLVRIAGIYEPPQHNEEYRSKITAAAKKMEVEVQFFIAKKEAEDWLEAYTQSIQTN